VFYPFCQAQELARCAKVFLYVLEGGDIALGVVCPVEIPRVEAREILDCAEDFIAAL